MKDLRNNELNVKNYMGDNIKNSSEWYLQELGWLLLWLKWVLVNKSCGRSELLKINQNFLTITGHFTWAITSKIVQNDICKNWGGFCFGWNEHWLTKTVVDLNYSKSTKIFLTITGNWMYFFGVRNPHFLNFFSEFLTFFEGNTPYMC